MNFEVANAPNLHIYVSQNIRRALLSATEGIQYWCHPADQMQEWGIARFYMLN